MLKKWLKLTIAKGNLQKVLKVQKRKNTIRYIVGLMNQIIANKCNKLINRLFDHFYKSDKELATEVAKDLSVNIKP